MQMQQPSVIDESALDDVFSALGHPARRAIVTRLGRGEATVMELAKPFEMSLPAVSKHLVVLERAGVITRTRVGRSRRCRLNGAVLQTAEAWLIERREFWTANLASFADFVERQEATDD